MLDGTAEGVLQGLVTDDYGNQILVRFNMTVAKKGIVTIFDCENPSLEGFNVTVPLRRESGDLYSFVLELSADRYGAKELAMNAVAYVQLWHRWLGHLHARNLDSLLKRNGTGITFEGAVLDCDIYAVEKAQQLAHPETDNHKVNRPFQLCYGDLMRPFTPVAIGGYKYVSKVAGEYTKWTAVYLLTNKNQARQSLQLFVGSTVIPFGGRIVRWRADKGGKYTGESFGSIAWGLVSSKSSPPPTRRSKTCVLTCGGNSVRHSSVHARRQRFSIHVGGAVHGDGVPQEQVSA